MYEKPLCDYGGELVFCVQEAITITKRITKRGQISKRESINRCGSSTRNWERLQCQECNREYEIERDSKGRVIRGDDWS